MGATVHLTFLELFQNDWFLLSDFGDFICGDFIGEGNSRIVYNFKIDDRYVIKIDKGGHFDNVSEWDLYHNIKHHHPEHLKILAPCHRISSCGRILLQRKTTPVKIQDLPAQVPDFLVDRKIQNWGKIGKQIVCHDYANHSMYNKETKLQDANWWSDSFQIINAPNPKEL